MTKEWDLVVITLKPDAEKSLRLKVVPVEKRRVPGARLFPGEVCYPLAGEGSAERFVPILMTASNAALALLPLVLKGNVPGNEIERPMALVILGGLVTSTLLNLFLLPALYVRFGKVSGTR